MYLFDKERTGRIPWETGADKRELKVIWETTLPQNPCKGPESSCVIDSENNIYFGCHDGCVYSLNSKGEIRWQFVTEEKVYSSPLLIDDKLYFCCNKADVICLNLYGKLLWKFKGINYRKKSSIAKLLVHTYSTIVYDYYFTMYDKVKNFSKVYAWCSPNLLNDSIIIANLYGIGIVALDMHDGSVVWDLHIGYPDNHLAGVAITKYNNEEFIAAVSQSNGLYWVNSSGKIIWQKKLIQFANSWGNPSIDNENNHIYCSTSQYNSKSWIFKFDFNGNLHWKCKLESGTRGAITISQKDYIIVPSLNGHINLINKSTGTITNSYKIADKDKGLWTSSVIDAQENIIINAKYNARKGALIKINKHGQLLWEYIYGKALSVPIIDSSNNIYTGTWDGKFLKLQS